MSLLVRLIQPCSLGILDYRRDIKHEVGENGA